MIDVTGELILVTYIEGQCIHAQLKKFPDSLLWQIHGDILRSLPENHKPPEGNLEPGTLVAVNIEAMYARAVVLRVFDAQRVLVELLDVGTREMLHLYEIRTLSKALSKYARMSVHVLLKQAVAVAAGEVCTLRDINVRAVCGQVHLYGVLEPAQGPGGRRKEACSVPAFDPTVELSCVRYSERRSADKHKDKLDDHSAGGLAAMQPYAGTGQLPNAALELPSNAEPAAEQTSQRAEEVLPRAAALKPSPAGRPKCEAFRASPIQAYSLSSQDAASTVSETTRPTAQQELRVAQQTSPKAKIPPAFTVGVHQVKVIDVAPHGQTVTVRCADVERRLHALEHRIQTFASRYRPPTSVHVDDYVLALYGGQEPFWSRALVNEVDAESIHVEYVDYAVFEHVPASNVRELPICFAQQAAYAATFELDVDVEVGRHYNVVIESAMDSCGRMFSAHVPDSFPSNVGKRETGFVCFKSPQPLGAERRVVFGIQKQHHGEIEQLEAQLGRLYAQASLRPRSELIVGDRVITIWEGIVCRAVVVAVDTATASVIHVDYGSRDRVLLDAVFDVEPGTTLDLPMLAFQCVLTNSAEAQIGEQYEFEIHGEISTCGGVPVYEATAVGLE